jgi:SAM-dependent methyltransferase
VLFGNKLALAWRRTRIDAYMRASELPRVNVGAGKYPMPGWLNLDLVPRHRFVHHADATGAMPLPDASVACVFREHMIEHLPFAGAKGFLAEAFRVPRPGGRIRLVTPDMERILALPQGGEDPVATAYLAWATGKHHGSEKPDPVFAVNAMFRFHGHQLIYTRAILGGLVERAGFTGAHFPEVGSSEDATLRGLESHGRFIGEPFNRLASMVVEAVKPG